MRCRDVAFAVNLTIVTNKPMFSFSKKGPVEYLEVATLTACNFLTHAFCTRRGGVSEGNFASFNFSPKEGDSKENVRNNWKILAEAFNLEIAQFLVVNQVHGKDILTIDRPLADFIIPEPPQFDAIITNQPGVAIGIKTADCVPIFFVDKVKRIIGVAHAGWRGTALAIAAKLVDDLVAGFGCRTDDLIAAIGPAIGVCCYQVDEPVFDAMKTHKDRESFLSPAPEQGKWMLDLSLANRMQIIGAGIHDKNICIAGYCTSCHRDMFYSHRGEGGNTGRQLNFIMLTPS
ncbi:MAG: peptidoglycan editing factor PgeF [Syntrophales bacterium]